MHRQLATFLLASFVATANYAQAEVLISPDVVYSHQVGLAMVAWFETHLTADVVK